MARYVSAVPQPYGLSRVAAYTLYRDGIPVWVGDSEPTQAAVTRAALLGRLKGWKGTSIELHSREGGLVRTVTV